ncbi:MAG: hypothetical protein ACR2O4_09675 [Hyphomicrobiaceae bacterium]
MLFRPALAVAALASVIAASPAAAQTYGSNVPYAYDTDDEDYGPRRGRTGAFYQVRSELADAGFSRISHKTTRHDRYGEPVYYLTACRRGIRYRLHVTADCDVLFKRRAGYCQNRYY